MSNVDSIVGWLSFLAAYALDVYRFPLEHIVLTGVAVVFILVFAFTHSSILCRQRLSEYRVDKKRVCCCADVVLGFALPIYTVLMWMTQLIQAQYLQRAFSGAPEPEEVTYIFQWLSLPVLVMYFSLFAYLFWRDSALDELQDYAAARICCFYC